ncbi:MAG: HAD family hydrolase [Deltaproteobacteria bacterium]|nr:HAD family hydrolase [Deltaproteobacteria bacterium]
MTGPRPGPRARPFVFLDRDGTLVRDTGYPHRPEDYALLPGAVAGALALARAGYVLAIATNQSGIGRGRFGLADFERFQGRLAADLAAGGVVLGATLLCPHAPADGCACRKPAPGLLLRARDELGADLAASWMVGDGSRDVEAARRAGCRGAVRVGIAAPARARAGEDPFALEARDLAEAARRILGYGAP